MQKNEIRAVSRYVRMSPSKIRRVQREQLLLVSVTTNPTRSAVVAGVGVSTSKRKLALRAVTQLRELAHTTGARKRSAGTRLVLADADT
jgi:hypothetical protein